MHGHGRGTRLGTCLVQLQPVSCVAASAARVAADQRCSIGKKSFNGNGSTTAFLVLEVVLHAVVVISEVLRLSTKSRC